MPVSLESLCCRSVGRGPYASSLTTASSGAQRSGPALASRVSGDKHAEVLRLLGDSPLARELEYLATPRLLVLKEKAPPDPAPVRSIGTVAVMCAGTADLSVAEEAAIITELCHAKASPLHFGLPYLFERPPPLTLPPHIPNRASPRPTSPPH